MGQTYRLEYFLILRFFKHITKQTQLGFYEGDRQTVRIKKTEDSLGFLLWQIKTLAASHKAIIGFIGFDTYGICAIDNRGFTFSKWSYCNTD